MRRACWWRKRDGALVVGEDNGETHALVTLLPNTCSGDSGTCSTICKHRGKSSLGKQVLKTPSLEIAAPSPPQAQTSLAKPERWMILVASDETLACKQTL